MTITQITLNLASYKAQKQKQLVLLTDINMKLTLLQPSHTYNYAHCKIVSQNCYYQVSSYYDITFTLKFILCDFSITSRILALGFHLELSKGEHIHIIS